MLGLTHAGTNSAGTKRQDGLITKNMITQSAKWVALLSVMILVPSCISRVIRPNELVWFEVDELVKTFAPKESGIVRLQLRPNFFRASREEYAVLSRIAVARKSKGESFSQAARSIFAIDPALHLIIITNGASNVVYRRDVGKCPEEEE